MDLEMWARLSSWPSLNLSNWHSEEDYGLGIPISMVIPDFSSQKSEDEAGAASAAEGGRQNLCDHLSMEDAGDEFCVVSRPLPEWYLNVFRLRIEEELEKRESSIGRSPSNTNYTMAMKEAESILTSVLFDVIEPIVAFENERVLDNMWVIMEDLVHLLEQEEETGLKGTAGMSILSCVIQVRFDW